MLVVLGLLTLAVTLMILVLLGFVLVTIRKEDRSPELASRPPTLAAALTRHLCGLHIRKAAAIGPAGHARRDGRLASRRIGRSDEAA